MWCCVPDVSLDDHGVVQHGEYLLALLPERGQRDVLVLALAHAVDVLEELARQLRVHREQVFLETPIGTY